MTPIDVTMTRLCIKCGERPATIPKLGNKQREKTRYCQTCWQAMPANQRAQSSRLNERRRVYQRETAQRRIRIRAKGSGQWLGTVKTIEQAQMIQAHIRRRVHGFKSGQSSRAKAESVSARGVSAQAGD